MKLPNVLYSYKSEGNKWLQVKRELLPLFGVSAHDTARQEKDELYLDILDATEFLQALKECGIKIPVEDGRDNICVPLLPRYTYTPPKKLSTVKVGGDGNCRMVRDYTETAMGYITKLEKGEHSYAALDCVFLASTFMTQIIGESSTFMGALEMVVTSKYQVCATKRNPRFEDAEPVTQFWVEEKEDARMKAGVWSKSGFWTTVYSVEGEVVHEIPLGDA